MSKRAYTRTVNSDSPCLSLWLVSKYTLRREWSSYLVLQPQYDGKN